MRLVRGHSDFRVYDDVLPAAKFRQVWRYVQSQEFGFVHRERWYKVWRLGDGEALWGPEILTPGAAAWAASHGAEADDLVPEKIFPTRRAIDHVIAAVERISGACMTLIGRSRRDWVGITAQSFLYPAGSGLSWHKDSSDRTGAFVYYAHPYWNVTYGGELLIAERDSGLANDAARRGRGRRRLGSHLDNEAENRALLARGIGTFIHAKPNRLIVLRGGTPHMIRAVTAAAGNTVRCSISGFFVAAR